MIRKFDPLKMIPLVLLLYSAVGSRADTISIYDAFHKAEQNFPLLKKNALYDQSLKLSLESLTSHYLPLVKVMGSATYQSDVVSLPFVVPGAEPLNLPHERLQAYLDVTQIIYDGGMTRLRKELQVMENAISQHQVEVTLQQLKEQVITTYFSILISQSSADILSNSIGLLKERLLLMQEAVVEGVGDQLTILRLEAEILRLEQKKGEVRHQRGALVEVLSILIGEAIGSNTLFVAPDLDTNIRQELVRPELELLSMQQERLHSVFRLQNATQRPKISAFGQGGVGYPNPFNFFNDEFSPYYLVGLRLSWNVLDWGNTGREQEILMLQSKMLDAERENLEQNIDMQLERQYQKILELERALEKDRELIRIQSEIRRLASLQFDEETISYNEYIESVNQQQGARLNYELHKTQLEQAKATYLNQQGAFFTTKNLMK